MLLDAIPTFLHKIHGQHAPDIITASLFVIQVAYDDYALGHIRTICSQDKMLRIPEELEFRGGFGWTAMASSSPPGPSAASLQSFAKCHGPLSEGKFPYAGFRNCCPTSALPTAVHRIKNLSRVNKFYA